jgi:hypothetical protein
LRGDGGQRCPYVENAPSSIEELQAWEITRKYAGDDMPVLLKAIELHKYEGPLVLDLVNIGRKIFAEIKAEGNP